MIQVPADGRMIAQAIDSLLIDPVRLSALTFHGSAYVGRLPRPRETAHALLREFRAACADALSAQILCLRLHIPVECVPIWLLRCRSSGFPNANALRALVRKRRGNGELPDRFLISAFIEACFCERFEVLVVCRP